MTAKSAFDERPGWRWDVALSFASTERGYVKRVAAALTAAGVRCFYDAEQQADLWGKHLAEELPSIYAEQAAAVVVFISAQYAERDWTRLERRSALNRAVTERREYVLPARFDDTRLPGMLSGLVAVDLRPLSPERFAAMVVGKLIKLGVLPAWLPGSAGRLDVASATAEPAPHPAAVRVADADPRRLGVHASIRVEGARDDDQPTYVERDVDGGEHGVRALLAKTSRRGGFVLLVGGSSVGKTRCAYEAVRAVLGDWWLIHPPGPGEVAALAAHPPRRTVVWLDEIQRYFGGERGLTGGTMRALLDAASPVVVIGTIWPDRYLAMTETPAYYGSDPYAREREVLQLAEEVVHVASAFTPAEEGRAEAAAAADRRLAVALGVAGYGMTQTLAAAPQLIRHWEIAKTVHPYAWAMLAAALDVSRLGAASALPEALLRRAAPGYCTDRQRAEAPADWFERGLAYATRRLHGAAAALTPVGGAEMGQTVGYVVADYLLQHAYRARAAEPVPASVWEAMLAHLDNSDDAVVVADSASARMLHRYAVPLYRRAADAGNGRATDQWVVHVGDSAGISELGARVPDGGGWYENGDYSDPAENLAEALVRLGELDQLRELCRPNTQLDSGARWSLSSRLAQVLADRGAHDELRALADSGDEAAAEQLAAVFASRGDIDGLRERACFEAGVVQPSPDDDLPELQTEQTAARERLATFLAHRNNLAELAARTDAAAARRLFTLLRHRGDVAGLRRLAAARSDDIGTDLVDLLAHRGDVAELLSLTPHGDEMLVGLARVFLHRGALDALQALSTHQWAASDALAHVLADRGELARLTEFAANDISGREVLLTVLAGRGDLAALDAFASVDTDGVARRRLNEILVNRGALDALATRARQGDQDATERLAGALADRGDVEGALRFLGERAEAGDAGAAWTLEDMRAELSGRISVGDEPAGDDVPAPGNPTEASPEAHLQWPELDDQWLDPRAPWPGEGDLWPPGGDPGAWPIGDTPRPSYEFVNALIVDLDGLRARADGGNEDAARRLASALARRGDLEELRARARGGDRNAAFHLVDVCVDRGDLGELRSLADGGDWSAAEKLADVLVYRGRVDELTVRADNGDTWASRRLVELLTRLGDLDALRRRADAGDHNAGSRWAEMVADRGDTDRLRARAGYDFRAAEQLADLLVDRGEVDELRARADNSDRWGADRAAGRLAALLADRGELDELRARADGGDRHAQEALAEILADRGELDELRARATGHADDHEAARCLVDLLVQQGDLAEAQRVLLPHILAGDHRGARRLPELLVRRGRHDQARRMARYGLNADGSLADPFDIGHAATS